MPRFLVSLTLIFWACSIVENSDITSEEELRKLKIQSITINQSLNSGNLVKTASVLDESVDFSTTLGQIKRRVRIAWPGVETNSKFKFHSGVTSNIEIRFLFGSDGQIRYAYVSSGGVDYEVYSFGYDSSGKIKSIVTSISQNGVDFIKTNDQFDPPGSFFAIRGSEDPLKRGVLGGNPQYINECTFKELYRFNWNPVSETFGGTKQYNYCGRDNFYIDPSGQTADFYVIGDILIEQVYIGNSKTPADVVCCNDTYYFHPYLFIPVDYEYRIMYAPDWWVESGESTPGKDESVQLKFVYGAE